MDVDHLVNIGLLGEDVACLRETADKGIAAYFSAHGELKYLQRMYQLPYRPMHISDLPEFMEWIKNEREQWPELRGVRWRAEPSVEALIASLGKVDGSLEELEKRMRECQTALRDCFANSDMCQALMRGESLWNRTHIDSLFSSKATPLPRVLCGHSRYTTLKWTEEYDGQVFLSIDMREANLSALRILASQVDSSLHGKIHNGWVPFLESLLGDDACLVRDLKPLREVVLGGLERAWLRRQSSLRGIHGIDSFSQDCEGAAFLRRALGDEECSPNQEVLYRKAFKQLRGRISQAYTEVQHLMIERVAAAVLANLEGLQLFALVGDEVIFSLATRSRHEADEMSCSVSETIRKAFVEERTSLAHAFRIESFCVLKISSDLMKTQSNGAYVALTRRYLEPGCWEAFPQFKGIRKDEPRLALSDCVRTLSSRRSYEWTSWLKA